MPHTKSYQLFVSNRCTCCDKILSYLKDEKIIIPTTNVDIEEYNLPFSLTIFPALVKEKQLISYGCDDIINHLKLT